MPISLTGSLNLSGSNTLIGTKTITGSVFISGSKTIIGTTSITGSLLVTGSLNTVGTITATTLVVQTITSSISSITGSTNFGSLSSNTHVFTGSIYTSGSVGIGTASPSAVFEVARATTSSINLANFFNSSSITGTENYIWVGKDGSTTGRAGLIDFIDNTDGASGYLALAVQGDNPKSGNGLFIKKGSYVGIGTNTPSQSLDISTATQDDGIKITSSTSKPTLRFYSTLSNAANRNWAISPNGQNYGDLQICTSAAQNGDPTASDRLTRLLITSAGYIGFGAAATNPTAYGSYAFATTSPVTVTSLTGIIGAFSDATYGTTRLYVQNGINGINVDQAFVISTGGGSPTERMRILSGGQFCVATTAVVNPGGVSGISNMANPNNDGRWALALQNNATTATYGRGIGIRNQTDFNSSDSEFIFCVGNSTPRFIVESNGGISNYSANNSNLSDIRTKKDIIPLESYWNKFKNIGIVKFKYKDQTHDDYNIGVIAQQVESVAPEFVNNDGWGETPEDGIPLKSIYETDLHHATIKVLQEAMAKIETLEARVQYLENK
jgi:hypothetical protein